MIRILLFTCVFILLTSHCTFDKKNEADNYSTQKIIDYRMENIFKQNELMGMSVLVVKDNRIVYEKYLGLSDLLRNIEVDENTMYRIASISKTVTATALMILYEEGRFRLDEDVSHKLGFELRNPRFPETPITYRMLLNHTSSLLGGKSYLTFNKKTYLADSLVPIRELVQPGGSYFAKGVFTDKKPGTYFKYSNLAYGIIATLVERLSGKRFDVFCQERIFEPLDMKATFNVTAVPHINEVAVLYRSENDRWEPKMDNYQGNKPHARNLPKYKPGTNGLVFSPQGGLRCSAKELSKFMMMHLNNGKYNDKQIVADSIIRLMHQTHWKYDGKNGNNSGNLFNEWGLGMQIISLREKGDIVFPERHMIGHPGQAYGLISDMYFDKKEKCGLIFITNGSAEKYKHAKSSAFYRPEEAVFQSVYEFLFQE